MTAPTTPGASRLPTPQPQPPTTNPPPTPRATPAALTDALVRELRERLPAFLATGDGGQRVVIHIAPGRKSAKIEWPPEVVEVKA